VTTMPKKKQREKVVAEITTFHLTQLAQTAFGRELSREEAIAFLNDGDRAYDMWKHMMHAGEAYIQSTIRTAGAGQLCSMERHA
jgi:hypothetical protein